MFLNSSLPFPDVVHPYGKLDAGVLWQLLDNYALIRVDLEVNSSNLLVKGVDAMHQLLNNLGFLRLLDDFSFQVCVNLVARNKFEETLHRFQD